MSRISDLISFRNLGNSSYDATECETSLVGTSDSNSYIPVYALWRHQFLKIKDTDIRIIEYALPITTSGDAFRNYRDVIVCLRDSSHLCRFTYKIAGVSHYLNITKGLIYNDSGEVLACLAINVEYLLATSREVLIGDGADPNAFILLMSDKFDAAEYKNPKKKFMDLYVPFAEALNIDIIRTKKINSWIFKNNVEKRKFKSISEMKEYTNSLPEELVKV